MRAVRRQFIPELKVKRLAWWRSLGCLFTQVVRDRGIRRVVLRAPKRKRDLADLPAREGWLSHTVVLDPKSRMAAGWEMQATMDRQFHRRGRLEVRLA